MKKRRVVAIPRSLIRVNIPRRKKGPISPKVKGNHFSIPEYLLWK
jgi:hypothetical protein